jgi:leucyl aminopeptidase
MTQILCTSAKKAPGVDLAVVPVFEGQALAGLPYLSPSRAKAAGREAFTGAKDQSLLLLDGEAKSPRLLLLGLGKGKDFTLDSLRKASQRGARQGRELKAKALALLLPEPGGFGEVALAAAAAEGALLGLYRYQRFVSKPDDKKDPASLALVGADHAAARAAVAEARVRSEAVCLARDLVNCPPSDLTPEIFSREAKKALAGLAGVSLKVVSKAQAARLGMGGLLGVSRGSDKPPVFLHITYKPKGKARRMVALVGKGVTFDSGGISLKPAKGMEDMKCDMSGAAAVLATVQAAARLKLPVALHGLCALTENMPGPGAAKPGDVFKAMNGKTIEVLNTDAEGRLILADALAYGARLKPDMMLDMATLTGAAVVALGAELTAVMGDQKVVDLVLAASKASGEKAWQLPLVPEYKEHMKSKIADIKNMGRAGQAGTIIGGLFLQEFKGDVPWAHLDIAGPAHLDSEAGLLPAGGTGVPVRTLLELLKGL